uniref:Uncharacterized protein n=1 Tax=Podoviridae sp. ct8Lf7 TaxID=2827723 RepID=A0A8S5S0K4_9CAUD|nr:MAG TPA: hypothetical protein [Podoviridae sp. ct8Lf7]
MVSPKSRYYIITNLRCKFFYIHYSDVLSGFTFILF